MSIQHVAAAMRHPAVTETQELAVLLVLAEEHRADRDEVFMAMAEIGERARMTARQARTWVTRLEAKGLVERLTRKGGRSGANRYRLHLDAGAEGEKAEAERCEPPLERRKPASGFGVERRKSSVVKAEAGFRPTFLTQESTTTAATRAGSIEADRIEAAAASPPDPGPRPPSPDPLMGQVREAAGVDLSTRDWPHWHDHLLAQHLARWRGLGLDDAEIVAEVARVAGRSEVPRASPRYFAPGLADFAALKAAPALEPSPSPTGTVLPFASRRPAYDRPARESASERRSRKWHEERAQDLEFLRAYSAANRMAK